MSYPLFITRNDIIKNSPLQGAIDADALLPFVRTAQDKYLKNLLGMRQNDLTSNLNRVIMYPVNRQHPQPVLSRMVQRLQKFRKV